MTGYDQQFGQVSTEEGRLTSEITAYWDTHIHDLAITTQPVGTPGFFQELDDYRFDKLQYLPRLVDFSAYRGKTLLEVGCGVGIDLLRFARAGAQVTGVDLSTTAIELARQNLAQNGLPADLRVMNGEALEFLDETFDVVYAHGVLQYTADARKMVAELYRVLKTSGEAILMVYNKYSWLSLISLLTKVPLEHADAPVLRKFSIGEFRQLLKPFAGYRLIPERFPVKTRLHGGSRGVIYNLIFVGAFNRLPKFLVRPFGWHLMAFAKK
ncbi:MAG TPA: class I SAM-dependent methyltransferase [Anaerolineales bacterium]|nr:class I SAM-dependent methyltransferase [Anaerolineales bacterium]